MRNLKTILRYSFYALLSAFIVSCNTARTSNENQNIEGCQYIVTKNSYGNGLTHKGNCNNPIHKCDCR